MKKELISVFLLIIFWMGCADKNDPVTNSNSKEVKPNYQLAKAEKTNLSQQIKLPAQLAAYEEVSIFPKVNGYVRSVLVDIGSNVRKGQILMILEAPELEQATVQGRERYARAKSDYNIDKENYERLKEASATPGAISPMDLATAKGKMDADSALSNAEKANWEMQQTMMSYLTVTAPFDGVITERNVHPGALVSAEGKDGKPMLELKQVSHLRLQVDIPENVSATLHDNDSISFYINALPGKQFQGRISRNSMNINKQFRSQRVELDVYNTSGLMAPGMYVDVLFTAKGNPGSLTVPRSAVVTSTERRYVLVVRDNKAHKVDVTTGNESAGKIEIFGNLKSGEQVISNANDEIKENTPVDVK